MTDATANMLRGVLACAERASDQRLNPHLEESDIVDTIRIAIEILDANARDTAHAGRYKEALLDVVSGCHFDPDARALIIPLDVWEKTIKVATNC